MRSDIPFKFDRRISTEQRETYGTEFPHTYKYKYKSLLKGNLCKQFSPRKERIRAVTEEGKNAKENPGKHHVSLSVVASQKLLKRYIDDNSSQFGTAIKQMWTILSNKLTNSTLPSNSRLKYQRTKRVMKRRGKGVQIWTKS